MYEVLKKIAKSVLSKNTLVSHEESIRKLLFPFYKGSRFTCTICGKGLKRFVFLYNGEKLCPYCGSLGRHRRLYSLIRDNINGKRILDFSPSRAIYRKLKRTPGIDYISTDFSSEFPADKKLDITAIAEPLRSFDVILCYHILEHIPGDRKAMSELYRVLKPGGVCWVQTPFKAGDIYEDPAITTPQARLTHFGQKDHVRIYSVAGLKQRLEEAGFKVEIKEFDEDQRYGMEREIVVECKKSS